MNEIKQEMKKPNAIISANKGQANNNINNPTINIRNPNKLSI